MPSNKPISRSKEIIFPSLSKWFNFKFVLKIQTFNSFSKYSTRIEPLPVYNVSVCIF